MGAYKCACGAWRCGTKLVNREAPAPPVRTNSHRYSCHARYCRSAESTAPMCCTQARTQTHVMLANFTHYAGQLWLACKQQGSFDLIVQLSCHAQAWRSHVLAGGAGCDLNKKTRAAFQDFLMSSAHDLLQTISKIHVCDYIKRQELP